MVLLIQMSSNTALAKSSNSTEKSMAAQEDDIQVTIIDEYTTEYKIDSDKAVVTFQETIIDSDTKEYLINDGSTDEVTFMRVVTDALGENKVIGWNISDMETMDSQIEGVNDFVVEKTDDAVIYQESGKEATVLATITYQNVETQESVTTSSKSTRAISFPTAWTSQDTTFSSKLANLSYNTVTALLLIICPSLATVLVATANHIIGLGSLFVTYTETYWMRLLGLEEQERYFVYRFYPNSDSSNPYRIYRTSNEILFLG